MRRGWLGAAVIALSMVTMTPRTEAHKPITSPFTYSADVRPILRERCGRCHTPGGVGPMSLLTYQDAVPWGESMRVELAAGHMPPWGADRGTARVRGSAGLTARELNVLLTWAAGGTPAGDVTAEREPPSVTPAWPMGAPDAVLELPAYTLAAGEQEHLAEFTLPAAASNRMLRAIDVLPGTPAIVRSAVIDTGGQEAPNRVHDEQLLALWVPGDDPAPLTGGALRIPADARLRVRVRYRRTWSYEGKALTDRSRVGLYFASAEAPTMRAITLSPLRAFALTQTERVVATYADAAVANAGVVVMATRPDGRREELVAFHPRPGWTRRFWFKDPITLPRGTNLTVRVVKDPPLLLPAGLATASDSRATASAANVTVNVVP